MTSENKNSRHASRLVDSSAKADEARILARPLLYSQTSTLLEPTKSEFDRPAGSLLHGLIRFRMALLAIGHVLAFSMIYWLSFALRFDFDIPAYFMSVYWASLPYVIVIKVVVFYLLGHYHGWWRHVTFADLVALLRAAGLSILVLATFERFNLFFSELPRDIPRSIFILDPILTVVLLGLLRSSWRLLQEGAIPTFGKRGRNPALLVGANHATARLANAIHAHPELPFSIRGFLSIDERVARGTRLGQIPVLGTISDVTAIAAATQARIVLVTAGIVSGSCLRRLMQDCEEADLELKIIPPVEGLFDGNRRIPLRDLNINDLLRRELVELDTEAIGKLLTGKSVMVTGAGGSIGSEICRQLLNFAPETLIMVGRGENRIFEIERELRGHAVKTKLVTRIADITDSDRMRSIFAMHQPQVVFHAAAHKHVPLMEQNIGEAIKNNVFGTKCVADLASEFGVERFVMVSTDKAVHPSSIMGVSKHIAERYVYTLSQESHTRFMVTRFGNVLGSAGSVVPIFQEQISHGGPITVTHPEMTRFFMTIPEASQLVLQAATMGRGGEIFVLEMGEPVRIVDLARDLIALSGLPENAVDIVFTGIRPGEKLHEELYFETEKMLDTAHPKLQVAYHRPFSLDEVREDIRQLEHVFHGPEEEIRAKLREIVPEYGRASEKSAQRIEKPVAPHAPVAKSL